MKDSLLKLATEIANLDIPDYQDDYVKAIANLIQADYDEEGTRALWAIQKTLPTLRDRMAMAALQALLTFHRDFRWEPDNLAHECYKLADALLEARKAEKNKQEDSI